MVFFSSDGAVYEVSALPSTPRTLTVTCTNFTASVDSSGGWFGGNVNGGSAWIQGGISAGKLWISYYYGVDSTTGISTWLELGVSAPLVAP